MTTDERRAHATAKATLTEAEVAALRDILEQHKGDLKAASIAVQLAPATVTRALAGLPVHHLTAAHLRGRIGTTEKEAEG